MPLFKRPLTIGVIVRTLVLFLLLTALLYYALFQARYLIDGPQIKLTNEPDTIQHEPIITIEGVAENITHLSLNGREVYTDESGVFREPLVLENGYTIMTLAAEDRFGRTTSLSRPFVLKPLSN